jgi:ATP-dependent Clp protease ATP-binding subunit ClpA
VRGACDGAILTWVLDRFGNRAREVVVQASEAARSLHHAYIGTEHLLLGLLLERRGVGARVLHSFGMSEPGVRARIIEIVGLGDDDGAGALPFFADAKSALERSVSEAMRLGDPSVETEHLLLGLVDAGGVAVRILSEFGADDVKIRTRVSDFRRRLG